MKKQFFLILLLALATNVFSQPTNTPAQVIKTDYLEKSKKQKTTAWVMLGGGAGIAIAGLAIISHDASWNASQDMAAAFTTIFTLGFVTPDPVEYKHSVAGPILAIAGTGAMLGSIPLFTSAVKNKRKANLMVKDENVFFNPQLKIKEHLIALGVKINL